jgi:PAS domain S-box-containing protein
MDRPQRNEEAYRALFGGEDLATFILRREIEACNDAACTLLGRAREEIVGRSLLEFSAAVQPDGTTSEEGGRKRIEAALAGMPQWLQWEFRRAGGEAVSALVHLEAVRVGSATRLAVRVRDLTHLWRAEASLKESETRLQQILDHTPAIVFAKDLAGRYVFANRQFARACGVPIERVLGRTAADLFPPEIAERFQRNDRRVLKKRRAIAFEDEIEVDGVRRTFHSLVFPLSGADGVPTAVCGILSDITGRKRTEEALRRAALAVSAAEGSGVFENLVQQLAEILDMELGMIAVYRDDDRTQMRTLAFFLDGCCRGNFSYALAGTPCAAVVGREFRFVEANASREFPESDMLARVGLESYAAFPLNDSSGMPLGLIAAMSRRPQRHAALAEAILKIFAMRASAEIERARASEALRASEASYRAIFEASEDPIFVHEWESGRILEVSPKAVELYGYSAEELRRVTVSDVSANEPPYTEAEAARLIERAKAQEAPLRFEWHARHKDGHRMWHEVTLKRAMIAGERRILAFVRDVTERRQAEQALRASEEQYRAIFNAVDDALVLRDAEFRVVDVNPAFLEMTGRAREEAIGADRVITNPPEANALFRELHARALAGAPIHVETDGMRKDGSRFQLEVRGLPIRYQGRPHVLFIGRDISARKRAEAERVQLEAQLRQAQKMEALGQLTGGIAHDFNNILASVMGYLTLAAERPAASGDAKLGGYLEQARAASLRARDLIQQMLTFSRGGRGERRAVSLAAVAEETAALLRSSLASSMEFALQLDAGVPLVLLDPVQAEQVLLNLCINARDAMGGRGLVRVAVRRASLHDAACASCRARVSGEFVELSVRDAGPGVPATVLERMFEPFFTTKEAGKGSGMGLATVHGIVHEHRGHVLVQTAPGRGAAFRVLFPVHDDADRAAGTEGRAPSVRLARARLRGHVLLVEDEALVAGFMKELLEGWGLQVSAKSCPVEAREAFEQTPQAFDLVLTDQTMPRLTGLDLARALQGLRASVPVVLYSGHAEGIPEARLKEAGVRALVRKPVEPAELLEALRANLPAL